MTSFDDETDPGPHTCVYIGTDQGDICDVCGEPAYYNPDEPIDWTMPQDDGPEYDYEGGGA